MFLNRNNLKIHNQRKAKEQIKLIQNKLLTKVEDVVNRQIPLEWQESENNQIFLCAMREVLEEESKKYLKI